MNGIEALQALKNGNKVRKVDWAYKAAYLFFNKQNNQIVWNNGNIYKYYAAKFLEDSEWEIYCQLVEFKDVPELSKIRCVGENCIWIKVKMSNSVNAIMPDKTGINFMGGLFRQDELVEVLPNVQETN